MGGQCDGQPSGGDTKRQVQKTVDRIGLGAISAPGYGDDPSELADDETCDADDAGGPYDAGEDGEALTNLSEADRAVIAAVIKRGDTRRSLLQGFSEPHEAVPWFQPKKDGKTVYKWSEVCKGKGNPRLFLDMWRMQFHAFLRGGDGAVSAIIAQAQSVLSLAPGLREPQYQQRSINTRHSVTLYGKLPHARPFGFVNILPKPKAERLNDPNSDLSPSVRARVDLLSETSLYMEGGKQSPKAMIAEGKGLYRRDNGAFPVELQTYPDKIRLTTIYDALKKYFDHDELKSKGDRYELEPRTVNILDKEYIGKETNPLDDGGIADGNFDLQSEDRPAVSVLRAGFNPVLHNITLKRLDEISAACGTSSRALLDTLAGTRGEYHRKAMAHYRTIFIFDENGELVRLDLGARKISKAATERYELGRLARLAFVKTKRATDRESQTQRLLGGRSDTAEERLSRLVNGADEPFHIEPGDMLALLTDEGIFNFFHTRPAKIQWLRARFETILNITSARVIKTAKKEAQREKRAANPNADHEYRAARRAAIVAHNSQTLERVITKLIGEPPKVVPTVESALAAQAWIEWQRLVVGVLASVRVQPDIQKALTTRQHAPLILLDALRKRFVDVPERQRELKRAQKRTQRATTRLGEIAASAAAPSPFALPGFRPAAPIAARRAVGRVDAF